MLQSGHLIDAAAEGPDVRLVVVWLVGEQLGAHVVGRANDSVSKVTGAVQHTRYAQVPHFDDVVLTEENVLGLWGEEGVCLPFENCPL